MNEREIIRSRLSISIPSLSFHQSRARRFGLDSCCFKAKTGILGRMGGGGGIEGGRMGERGRVFAAKTWAVKISISRLPFWLQNSELLFPPSSNVTRYVVIHSHEIFPSRKMPANLFPFSFFLSFSISIWNHLSIYLSIYTPASTRTDKTPYLHSHR